jgi:hypothetical protein
MPDYTYLYGFTADQVANLTTMPYVEALKHKTKHANELANRLLSVHFTEQDASRINRVLKAAKFNQQLIQELS